MRWRTRPTLPLLLLLAACGRAGDGHAATMAPDDISDLPLVEMRSRAVDGASATAIFLSGDGGWRTLARDVALRMSAGGIDIVGIDLPDYLHTPRTPAETADAVARVMRHYGALWHTDRFILVGYSRGGDILPFILPLLPAPLRANVELLAMFGLTREVSFEFHRLDVIFTLPRGTDRPVLPAMQAVRGAPMLCIYGAKEKESPCRDADASLLERIERPGGHHFDRHYDALADAVLARPR